MLAGPGTGKTFSIMKRVSRLIEEEDNIQSILLVTFTRMAAQDLNKAEQVLIQHLVENENNLCVAGDDDQSIYGFKYAHPDGIKNFDSVYPTTHDEVLTECRRCPKNIVRIAKELIAKNNRYPKVLTEKSDNMDGEIHILQWNGPKKEAEGIGKIVKHFIKREGI